MQRINHYWVDGNNNKWSTKLFSYSEAILLSATMVGSYMNIDCSNLVNSTDCKNSSNLTNCFSVVKGTNCTNARYSYNISNCTDCSWLTNCSNLTSISKVSYFYIQPSVIESKEIGSRKAKTIVYYTEENCIVHCGCFSGTILSFKAAIEAKYCDMSNAAHKKYRTEYYDFIDKLGI